MYTPLPMSKKDEDITPAVLLDHMQAMQRALVGEIKKNRDGINRNREGINRNTASIKSNGERIDRLRVNLTAQINGIDKRLDAIEIERLPMRVTALEEVVFV